MVKAFDRTGDGRLHYHEFVRLLTATRAEAHEEKTASAPEGSVVPASSADRSTTLLTIPYLRSRGKAEN